MNATGPFQHAPRCDSVMAEKRTDECECVRVHGLSTPSALCAGALDGGEGLGMFYWRRGCKQLFLKGVKPSRCTRSSLGGGVQCDTRHGTAVSLNNVKYVFFQEAACLIPIKC